MKELFSSVLSVLKECLADHPKEISLHEPSFAGNEWHYVKECLDSGWVSSVGKFVDRFEKDLAEYTGAQRAIAVVNGTAALHVCLKLVGVESKDEVLIPALTFVAPANAVSYLNAIPHFIDSEEKTLGIDPSKLAVYLKDMTKIQDGECRNKMTGRRIKALIPMHTFGHPVDMDPVLELCSRYKLELVEDCAESLGSLYKGHHTGTMGRVSAFSFNGNKICTTGGGGAILTNDEKLGTLAKHITTTARSVHQWEISHDMIGYNYRLPNINAALGVAQLEQLPEFVSKKRMLAERYRRGFKNTKGLRFFVEPEFARSNYWLNALLLDTKNAGERDNLLEKTNSNGIMTRPAWKPMHLLPMFKNCPRMDLSVTEDLAARIINIPSSSFL